MKRMGAIIDPFVGIPKAGTPVSRDRIAAMIQKVKGVLPDVICFVLDDDHSMDFLRSVEGIDVWVRISPHFPLLKATTIRRALSRFEETGRRVVGVSAPPYSPCVLVRCLTVLKRFSGKRFNSPLAAVQRLQEPLRANEFESGKDYFCQYEFLNRSHLVRYRSAWLRYQVGTDGTVQQDFGSGRGVDASEKEGTGILFRDRNPELLEIHVDGETYGWRLSIAVANDVSCFGMLDRFEVPGRMERGPYDGILRNVGTGELITGRQQHLPFLEISPAIRVGRWDDVASECTNTGEIEVIELDESESLEAGTTLERIRLELLERKTYEGAENERISGTQ